MQVGEVCNRDVVIIGGDESAQVAVQLMREHHVGDVILTEERAGKRIPVGIVTDRDLVLELMAPGVSPDQLAVRDVVIERLVTIPQQASLYDALEVMRAKAIRRLPVVDDEGALVGIITIDDVIALLAEMVDRIVGVIERQQAREARERD